MRIQGTDPITLTCKACKHPILLHPGITNPEEQECAMCHLLHVTRRLEIPE